MIGDSCTLPMPHRTDVSRRTLNMGQKRTLVTPKGMSALPPKADIAERDHHVRFVPKADICTAANSRYAYTFVPSTGCAAWYSVEARRCL
jgi:hypothetical protein